MVMNLGSTPIQVRNELVGDGYLAFRYVWHLPYKVRFETTAPLT